MTILGLEFSADLRSAAVLRPGGGIECAQERSPREAGPIGLIEQALGMAGVEREQIDLIAIGLGPGSYTGIRAAIAVAQGWWLARAPKLVGISSMDILAEQIQESGVSGRVNVVVNAQRGEIYWAQYYLGQGERRVVRPLCLARWDDLCASREAGEPCFGPDRELSEHGVKLLIPSAATLAGQASGDVAEVQPERLEPIYLRPILFAKAPPPRILPVRQEG